MAQVVPPNEAGQAQIEFFIGLAFEGEMPLGPIKLQLPHLAAQTAETAWIKYQRKIGKRYYCLIKVTKPRCFDYESHRVIGDLTGIWLFFVKSTEEDARKKIDSYDSFPVNQHDERM